MAMQTTVERVEGAVPVTVMALSGELDASNYLRLVDDVKPLYDAGARHLLLDMTDLTFISSSGLVSLYSILKVMQGEEPPDPEYGWSALHAMERDAVVEAETRQVDGAGDVHRRDVGLQLQLDLALVGVEDPEVLLAGGELHLRRLRQARLPARLGLVDLLIGPRVKGNLLDHLAHERRDFRRHGAPARARSIAARSARSFDRQYGPTASRSVTSTSSAIGPTTAEARVRMLSVLQCSTRSAPAARPASSTWTAPRWLTSSNSLLSRTHKFEFAAR